MCNFKLLNFKWFEEEYYFQNKEIREYIVISGFPDLNYRFQ